MKQVVVIGGGETWADYEDYLHYLRNHEFDIFSRSTGWKDTLQEDLGKDYQVIRPRMPDSQNAKYEEWIEYFLNISQHFESDAVFVGHSLGGLFLLRFLQEYNLEPRATIFVAAPAYNCETFFYSVGDYSDNLGKVHIFHSEDDEVVPLKSAYVYKSDLLDATMHIKKDSGHFFMQTNFPELVKTIKSLWRK